MINAISIGSEIHVRLRDGGADREQLRLHHGRRDGSRQDAAVHRAHVDAAGNSLLELVLDTHTLSLVICQRQGPTGKPLIDKAVIVAPSSLVKVMFEWGKGGAIQ